MSAHHIELCERCNEPCQTAEPHVCPMTPKGGTPSMGAAHTPTPKDEPYAVTLMRYLSDANSHDVVTYIDALAAERDASVQDADYFRRVAFGVVVNDKLAATCKTIGEYRALLLKTLHALGLDTARTAATAQGDSRE